MPVSKKREKHKKRNRDPKAPAAASTPEAPAGGGLLTSMRGGIKNVAGTGPRKPESLVSKILTWALIAAAAYFVLRRFGILP